MSGATFRNDFTSGKIFPQIIRFSLPLFLANVLQVCYNVADMAIVGHAMGQIGLSAASIGGDVSHFLTFLAMGFSNAGQVIIAQYAGAKRERSLERFIGTMFFFLTACALVLTVGCFFFRRQILVLMNTPAAAFDETLAYSTVCIIGLPFIYGYNIVSAVLRGLGDSRHPFLFIGVAAALNVVLDLAFVYGLQMGAAGAAVATVISQSLSFLCCLAFIFRKREHYQLALHPRDFVRPDGEMLKKLIRLGVPMALKTASIWISKLVLNSFINAYGVAVSAFAGIAGKMNSIGNTASSAMNAAGAAMIAQNIGAEKYDRVPKILKDVFLLAMGLAVLLSAVLVLFPREVFSLFTDEEEVLAIGLAYVPLGVMIFFSSAFRAAMNALINGCGNSRVNFIVAILDAFVLRLGLAFLFGMGFDMGYMGYWLGDGIAAYSPFFIGLGLYLSGRWKKSIIQGGPPEAEAEAELSD